MGGVARAIPAAIKGAKMMDSGSSEQEARSYMESQGLKNINFIKNTPASETKTETVEGSEGKRLIKAKKRGRASTVLSSSSGTTDEAITSKKTLLGS